MMGYLTPIYVFCALFHTATMARIQVDMTGSGCFDVSERPIADNQVYTVYADYKPNQVPTLDHCDVSIRATESNRRLEYLVEKLTLFDCTVEIWIYDNPKILTNPTRILKCDDNMKLPIQGKTSHDVIKFTLRKESSEANAFQFQIQIKTDNGPPFDFETASSEFYEMPLDTGAIVGIVIAGSVLIIAVAGISIYCCLKNRNHNKQQEKKEPSVFTSGTSAGAYEGGSPRHTRNGGARYGPVSQDRGGRSSVRDKASLYSASSRPEKDRSIVYENSVYTDKERMHYENEEFTLNGDKIKRQNSNKEDAPYGKVKRQHSNKEKGPYADKVYPASSDKKFDRQDSLRRGSQRGSRRKPPADDDPDSPVRGGHVSRRDSSRNRGGGGGGPKIKYDKKKQYSRNEEYSTTKSSKQSGSRGHRSRSKSPSHSVASLGSTVDSSYLVYGYNHSAHDHPNMRHVNERERSRSRSRSRSRAAGTGAPRSGSGTRSRTGSVGRSAGRDTNRPMPKNSRQYGNMTDFLDRPDQQDGYGSRSRSGSMGRSSRRH